MNHLLDLVAVQLALAIGLGLLVGMQREWADDKPLGLRSFALITLVGAITGLYSVSAGFWAIGLGLVAVTSAVVVHSILLAREKPVAGMTTELAAIAMFLIGAMTTSGWIVTAVVLTGAVTLLLHWKQPLHDWVEHIEVAEFQAVARFVLVTLVILPVLPNRTFGPYDVLNPFQIWLMVVLIVALNLVGYFGLRMATGRGGALASGVLGGLVSSTATTMSFTARSRKGQGLVAIASVIILVASAVVYLRVVVETLAVAPSLLGALAGPLAAYVLLFAIVIAFYLRRFHDGKPAEMESGNPAELPAALFFGGVYSLVIFVSAAVSHHFGETMLYPVAVLSGLTDVDAITLSTARLFAESRIGQDTAWRVIFVASLANLVFKAGIVAVVGGPELRRRLLPPLGGLVLAGTVLVVAWP